MSECKRWQVGDRIVSLRNNGTVVLAEKKFEPATYGGGLRAGLTDQVVAATSRAGVLALIEALKECSEEMDRMRGEA